MATYSVVAADGQLYGPVDETALQQWVREGRVNAHTQLHCHENGQRIAAGMVAALQPALASAGGAPAPGYSPPNYGQQQPYVAPQNPPVGTQPQQYTAPPTGYSQQGGYMPPGGPQPGPYQQPGPQQGAYAPPGGPAPYGQPNYSVPGYAPQPPLQPNYAAPSYGGYPFPPVNTLSEFPVVVVILLMIVTDQFFNIIYYGLMHGKLPRLKADDPSPGKAIGFSFIPFFNIYWFFFSYLRLTDKVNAERARFGLPPKDLKSLIIAYAALLGCGLVFLFVVVAVGIVAFVAAGVVGFIFFGSLQSAMNELVVATRQRGFPVQPMR